MARGGFGKQWRAVNSVNIGTVATCHLLPASYCHVATRLAPGKLQFHKDFEAFFEYLATLTNIAIK